MYVRPDILITCFAHCFHSIGLLAVWAISNESNDCSFVYVTSQPPHIIIGTAGRKHRMHDSWRRNSGDNGDFCTALEHSTNMLQSNDGDYFAARSVRVVATAMPTLTSPPRASSVQMAVQPMHMSENDGETIVRRITRVRYFCAEKNRQYS